MRITIAAVFALAMVTLTACEEPTNVPTSADSLPPPPAWSASMIGQPVSARFTAGLDCRGFVDVVRVLYQGEKPGSGLEGWGWDGLGQRKMARVLIVDSKGVVVGAGEGGRPRPDVPKNMPVVTATDTGWFATSPITRGQIEVWGLQNNDAQACKLASFRI